MRRILDNYSQSITAYLNYGDTFKLQHLGYDADHVAVIYWLDGEQSILWDKDEPLVDEKFLNLDYKENLFKKSKVVSHVIPAISLEDAVNFLRITYNTYITVVPTVSVNSDEKTYIANNSFIWKVNRFDDDNKLINMFVSNSKEFHNQVYSSYQAALEAGILEMIRIINNEKEPELPFEPFDPEDELPY